MNIFLVWFSITSGLVCTLGASVSASRGDYWWCSMMTGFMIANYWFAYKGASRR